MSTRCTCWKRARAANIHVPEQVAIVGAENYLLAPDAMHTPISSVDTNLETLGYRGAALLDDLMNGKKAPAEPIRVPALGMIVRKSSDLLAVNHKGVANSLRFIWEHCHEMIGVEDLVGVAAMSRRGIAQGVHGASGTHAGAGIAAGAHRAREAVAARVRLQAGGALEHVRLPEREQFLHRVQTGDGDVAQTISGPGADAGEQ